MIILWTTHCPRCGTLKRLLDEKNIKYIENEDIKTMQEKGFTNVPMLEINEDTILDFPAAMKWVIDYKGE